MQGNPFQKKKIAIVVARAVATLFCCTGAVNTYAQAKNQEKELGAIIVTTTGEKKGVKPRLRDEIIKTESFDAKAIEKTGASNITEVLDKNPGIAVQVECSICNVRNVLLNNMPGRFTTLLIDGIPIYSAVSSAYGLDSVGINGVERIDVSRGAGTSLIAPEALAGVVNIITKRPTRDEAVFQAQAGSYQSKRFDTYLAKALDGGALSVAYNFNDHPQVDEDDNGISEYTGYVRNILGFGYFVDDVGGFTLKGRIDGIKEKRGGGAMGRDYDAIKASFNDGGNPFDWRKGPHGSTDQSGWIDPVTGAVVPWTAGRGGLSEIIFTDRVQTTLTAERKLGSGKLRLAGALAEHKQDSFYEGDTYNARQNQYYLEASYQMPVGALLLTGGMDYRYENLKSHGLGSGGTMVNNGIDNYTYHTPGVFLQIYRTFLDDTVEVNASLRHDDHNVFGSIFSPRLNVLLNHNHELSSRFAVGSGFRAPTSFFEQDHGILSTTSIVRQINEVERSQNVSYALNYAGDTFAWTTSYNFNRVKNFALLDPDQCRNAAGAIYAAPCMPGEEATLFTAAPNPVTIQGIDFTGTYKFTPALAGTFGAEYFNYKFDPGTLAFARPKTRVYLAADYDIGDWDVTVKAVWTGPQDLARFHDYANSPRYHFDGTAKPDRSPSFWTVDLRAQYNVNKTYSLFAGVDNLFDTTQAKKDGFVFTDNAGG